MPRTECAAWHARARFDDSYRRDVSSPRDPLFDSGASSSADRLIARVVQVFGAAQAHHGYLFANAARHAGTELVQAATHRLRRVVRHANELLKEAVEYATEKKWIARSPLLPGDGE